MFEWWLRIPKGCGRKKVEMNIIIGRRRIYALKGIYAKNTPNIQTHIKHTSSQPTLT